MCRVTESNLILFIIRGHPVFPSPYTEDAVFFQCILFLFFFKYLTLCLLMFQSYVLFHWCTCLFLCQYHIGFYYNSSIIYPEVRNGAHLILFFVQSGFGSSGSFFASIWILGFLKISVRYIGVFDWNSIESINCF